MNKNKAKSDLHGISYIMTTFLTPAAALESKQSRPHMGDARHLPASHSDRFQQQQPSHVPGVEQAKRHRPKLFLTQIYELYTKEPVSNLLFGWELTSPVML